ncbi:uncharacterized protein K489DRAFT_384548 [Dissoconium aciculare CBS 342.82]|uniref:Uncharacterized protein n=1 Tax=Dissoconium aciculare CBS 342.82 TaxID=1314786 RepID=A0A6J3LVI7_9PEZI|nr:uncharacterized protein K489DRAFT_384548 [Dissoconium aciculare CBS 342.82]KAF1818632.1 hypothetical protein K489DRAFT_384548 [Dissoconium aciculare CBS 342.82]
MGRMTAMTDFLCSGLDGFRDIGTSVSFYLLLQTQVTAMDHGIDGRQTFRDCATFFHETSNSSLVYPTKGRRHAEVATSKSSKSGAWTWLDLRPQNRGLDLLKRSEGMA